MKKTRRRLCRAPLEYVESGDKASNSSSHIIYIYIYNIVNKFSPSTYLFMLGRNVRATGLELRQSRILRLPR